MEFALSLREGPLVAWLVRHALDPRLLVPRPPLMRVGRSPLLARAASLRPGTPGAWQGADWPAATLRERGAQIRECRNQSCVYHDPGTERAHGDPNTSPLIAFDMIPDVQAIFQGL